MDNTGTAVVRLLEEAVSGVEAELLGHKLGMLKRTPLVRVVETNHRTLPLTKIEVAVQDDDAGLLEEATDDVVTTLMFDAAEKLIADACKTPDYTETIPFEPQVSDPEVEALLGGSGLLGGDDELGADLFAEGPPDPPKLNPEAEKLLSTDSDDIEYDESDDIDAGMAFDEISHVVEEDETTKEATTDVAEETEMKSSEPTVLRMDEVGGRLNSSKTAIALDKAADLAKAAEERGSLQYLKSVEGRVLTIMEAAIPNDAQRDAIKTLIKKEFRREMTKANRGSFASDED
jgi:hypothetical protein